METATVLAAGFYDAGLGRFLVSPGFGGAAALLGGLLAFRAAWVKLKADSEVARQDRWWISMTWIYEQATSSSPSNRLPGGVAVTMLGRLFDAAQTELEIHGVVGLLELFDVGGETDEDGLEETR